MAEIVGGPGNDSLTGTPGADILRGLGGNDTLRGGNGTDQLYGGADDDIYVIDDDSGDQVFELAGEGFDIVYVAHSYTLRADSYVERLSANSTASLAAIDLTGNNLANTLLGNEGANVLNGGGGIDYLYGYGGNDTYYVDDAADRVFETGGAGTDTIYSSVSYVLGAGQYVENLSTISHGSTSAINLTGNSFNNTLIGNAGANILNGGGGTDVLQGLGGDDIYYIDVAAVQVVEDASGGNDLIYTSVSYTLGAAAQVEALSTISHGSTAAINLTGNGFNNTLVGNAGANVLNGGGGNDTLQGLGGDDIYYVDSADLVIETNGGGNDTIHSSVSYTLAANVYVETLTTSDAAATTAIDLTGNSLNQMLIGNAGANILRGGGGTDVLQGLGGNDTYYTDVAATQVVEAAGGGSDKLYTSVSYTLGAGVEIEFLSANSYAATSALSLTGNAFGQSVVGNAGANMLDGKGGNDTLTGFGGADIFAFSTALGSGNLDRISDFQPGTDKIQLGGQAGEPFAALASGALAAGAFVAGAAAAQADDYIIYNSATGALLYDADGNGAAAAVQFATLSTGLSLTATDFIVSGPANTVPVVTSGASATIAENSPASTIVYQATATDANSDRITWTLGGADAGYLTIDAVTGAVRLINSADFETKTSYAFSVTASDSGSTAATKQVNLNVTDVADTTSTPIVNETSAANDGTGAAQAIDRNMFTVSANTDLPNQALPSATIHGSIATNNDVDFYAITLQAGEQIVLDVDHTTNSLDSFLRFYGPNGIEIVFNDDKISSDPGSNPPFDHNTDSYLTYRVGAAGTYYFSVESFGDLNDDGDDDGSEVGVSSGSYSLNVSIGPPASAAQIMNEDVDAMLSGAQWNHVALTYGFPTDISQYPSDIKETTPATDFSPFTAAQQTATAQLLQLIANISSLTFQQLSASPGNADIRYAMSSEAEVAYAYYPTNDGPSSVGGTAWFNKTDFNNPVKGNYAWMGILHESGHAVGLKHPFEAPAVSFDHDSVEYSVMTYRSYPGQDLNGYTNEQWGFPQSLMMLDIAALQRMYGANFNTNAGSSVYSWNATTGEMSINGAGQGAPGNGLGGSANRVFQTIWDGGGNDTYDLSNYANGSTIDLRPGEWTTTSQAQIANLGLGHMARGNVANALLYQGNTASLIENAIGGSGQDTLIANQAANHLTGGAGSDVFKWMSSGDAGTGSLADTIMDFQQGADQIHLLTVDAIPATANNDDFIFIGTNAFHNVAGELRYEVEGANARIQADLDGNGTSDFEIVVNGVTTLTVGDFFF